MPTKVFACLAVLLLCSGAAAAQRPDNPTVPPHQPPFPDTTRQAEVLANLLWSLAQSHIDPALEEALRQGRVVVPRMLDVESAIGPNYYPLDIDTDTVKLFRTVLISKDGWL